MTKEKIVIDIGKLKEILENKGDKLIPFSEMKKINPVAAYIKKGLGKDFFAINIVRNSPEKDDRIETVIFPKKPAHFNKPSGPVSFRTSACLMSILKYPGEKDLRIKINARMGDVSYSQDAVKKAGAVVKSVLTDAGMHFTVDKYSYYRHNGVKIRSVVVDGGIQYGNYNRSPKVYKILNNIPQYKHSIINTGRRRDLMMKYHR